MGVRYSYDDFTTKGHGVIEYANSPSEQGAPKRRKRRKNADPRLATRWPSAKPLARASSRTKGKAAVSHTLANERALKVFLERHPGQKPKKGDLKKIKKELGLKPRTILAGVSKSRPPKVVRTKIRTPESVDPLDTLARARFAKLYPGQSPTAARLAQIKLEIAAARSRIGL